MPELERPSPLNCTVLMGDLIGSDAGNRRARMAAVFNDAIDEANGIYAARLISPLTITLGDEFQGLATTLNDGLLIARHLRLRLLNQGVGCRFVVGLVSIETPVNRQIAWNMMGSGLSPARERLNDKRETSAYRFTLDSFRTPQILMDGIGDAMTFIEEKWSTKQASYVQANLLGGQSAAEAARTFGISSSAYYKALRTANLPLYNRLMSALEEAASQIDLLWRGPHDSD